MSVTDTVAADASGTLVNEASVFGDDPDPDPANNVARSAITVTPLPVPAPDPGPQPISNLIGYQARQPPHRGGRGRQLTYTIKVTNAGPNAAHDVQGNRRVKAAAEGSCSIHPKQGSLCDGTANPLPPRDAPPATHTPTITIRAIAEVAGFQVNAAVATSRQLGPHGERQPGARQDQGQAGRQAPSAARHGPGLSHANSPGKTARTRVMKVRRAGRRRLQAASGGMADPGRQPRWGRISGAYSGRGGVGCVGAGRLVWCASGSGGCAGRSDQWSWRSTQCWPGGSGSAMAAGAERAVRASVPRSGDG